jgi:hypothetical protein
MCRWVGGVRSASTASHGHGQGISVTVGGEVVVVGRANMNLTVRIPCLPTPGRAVLSVGLTPLLRRRASTRRLRWLSGAQAGRFELQESTWVEPVPPEPLPNTCPWCLHGAPRTLRHAAQDNLGDVYIIAASENPDGSGRALTIQTADDEAERSKPYSITLEPGHATHSGGITNYKITTGQLTLQLAPAAAQDLRVDPNSPSPSLSTTSNWTPSAPAWRARYRHINNRLHNEPGLAY